MFPCRTRYDECLKDLNMFKHIDLDYLIKVSINDLSLELLNWETKTTRLATPHLFLDRAYTSCFIMSIIGSSHCKLSDEVRYNSWNENGGHNRNHGQLLCCWVKKSLNTFHLCWKLDQIKAFVINFTKKNWDSSQFHSGLKKTSWYEIN